MELYNETHKVIKAIRKRFNIYHEIPCTADDRRVQEIISIVVQTIEALPSADVVPKSEVDRLNSVMKDMDEQRAYTINMLGESLEKAKREVERLQGRVNRLKKYDEERDIALHARLIAETREKVAREIFEDLQGLLIMRIGVNQAIAELKKKYTEGET